MYITTVLDKRRRPFAALAMPAVMVVASAIAGTAGLANAAELKILSGRALKATFGELGQQFEAATGHKLVIEFGSFAGLKRRIDSGETFDVTILSPAMIDDLIQHGKVSVDTRTKLGRTGVGVAVRKGAPKPDISSVEAFKRAMLDAKSVAHSKEGSSRKVLFAAFDRLGITADMKPKLKAYVNPEEAVAAGEAELGVTGIGPILAAPGAQLVGGFPPEIQSYVAFAAGVSAGSTHGEAARALIQYLAGPAAARVLRGHGIEPG